MVMQVVCLDGTDEVSGQPFPTNIAKIFRSLGGASEDAGFGSLETVAAGQPGVSGKYLPGVGSQGDPALKFLGSAFGEGIAELIVRGYTFLSRKYDPGDEIVLVGFSRGATAARALAGMIVAQGLLDRTKYVPADKTDAYLHGVAAWFAYRKPHPNIIDQVQLAQLEQALGLKFPKLAPANFTPPPAIRAVAVFDTVSSLGLPRLDFDGDALFDFSIIDTNLSDRVQNGFHALSADEARDLFSPTFWAKRAGVFQQVFPGCHSDVGGGFPNSGLSDAALVWMLDQLGSVGLPCDRTKLNLAPNPLATAEDDGATPPFNRTPRRPRVFPDHVDVSDSLRARWNRPTEMLPSLAPSPYRAVGTKADGSPLL